MDVVRWLGVACLAVDQDRGREDEEREPSESVSPALPALLSGCVMISFNPQITSRLAVAEFPDKAIVVKVEQLAGGQQAARDAISGASCRSQGR